MFYHGNDPRCLKMREYTENHNPILEGIHSLTIDEAQALADATAETPVQAVVLAFFYGQTKGIASVRCEQRKEHNA